MIPQLNEEHYEAGQHELNERNEQLKETLDSLNKAKFDAVSQAMKILSDAKVLALLFPILTSPKGGESVYQFNNGGEFAVWKEGKLTKQSQIDAYIFNMQLFNGFINYVMGFNPSFTRLEEHVNFLYESFIMYNKGVEPEYVTQLRKEIEEEEV